MRDKEPKIIEVESPGRGFTEQVVVDGKSVYALYRRADPQLIASLNKKLREEGKPPLPAETVDIESKLTAEEGLGWVKLQVPLKRCPWPMPGMPEKAGENLWEDVKAFVLKHIDLMDPRLYDMVTAWVFTTWIPEIFVALPYLWIQGPKASGKTRLLEVLQATCRRGVLAANISEAALFRSIEAFQPTLLLDEASEVYNREAAGSIQSLLNAGYRRGQYVIRVAGVDAGEPKLELFEVFGPKALAGLGGYKETLESRSIRIDMEKATRPIEFSIDAEEAKKLRSRLLMWRWNRLSDVSGVSDVLQQGVPKELEFADGRFAELWSPLIIVANDGLEAVISYARDAFNAFSDEEKTSNEARLVEAIIKTKPFLESGKFSTALVTEKFNEGFTEDECWTSRSVGWLIRRLGFKPKRLTGGGRGWVWDEDRLKRLTQRYNTPPVTTSLTSQTSLIPQDESKAEPAQPGSPEAPPTVSDKAENPLQEPVRAEDRRHEPLSISVGQIYALARELMKGGEAMKGEDLIAQAGSRFSYLPAFTKRIIAILERERQLTQVRPGFYVAGGGT
jgi:hypothetical protein